VRVIQIGQHLVRKRFKLTPRLTRSLYDGKQIRDTLYQHSKTLHGDLPEGQEGRRLWVLTSGVITSWVPWAITTVTLRTIPFTKFFKLYMIYCLTHSTGHWVRLLLSLPQPLLGTRGKGPQSCMPGGLPPDTGHVTRLQHSTHSPHRSWPLWGKGHHDDWSASCLVAPVLGCAHQTAQVSGCLLSQNNEFLM
jgi:hypothetical protein